MALTQRDQIMIVIWVAALGLGYVYYEYLWSPKSEQLIALAGRVDTLQTQNETVRRDIARGTAGKLREEAEQYGRLLGVMRQLVPLANEVPTLLDQISTAARRTGLELGAVTPLGIIPGEIFDTHRYNMTVTGPYHRIAQFLSNVGSVTRIEVPMNLSKRPWRRAVRDGPREQRLDASFEVQTFVAKSGPPSAAPISAPRGGQ